MVWGVEKIKENDDGGDREDVRKNIKIRENDKLTVRLENLTE